MARLAFPLLIDIKLIASGNQIGDHNNSVEYSIRYDIGNAKIIISIIKKIINTVSCDAWI